MFTLQFEDKDLEAKYRKQFQADAVKLIRIILVLVGLYFLSIVGMIIYRYVSKEGSISNGGASVPIAVAIICYAIFITI